MTRLLEWIERLLQSAYGPWYRVARIAWLGFSLGSAVFMAAAIAFYSIVCLGPLGLLAVMALRAFYGPDTDAYAVLREMVTQVAGGDAAAAMLQQIDVVLANPASHTTSLASVVILIWAGLSLFAIIERALTAIWPGRPRRRILGRYLVAFGTMLVAGGVVLAYVVLNALLVSVRVWLDHLPGLAEVHIAHGRSTLLFAVTAGLIWAAFFLTYKTLPVGRVSSRVAAVGAIWAAYLWHALSPAFVWLIGSSQRQGSIYGGLAGVVVFLLWAFLGARILLFGAYFALAWEHVFLLRRPPHEDDALIHFPRRVSGQPTPELGTED